MLNQIYYHFTFKDYKINDVIYKESDPADRIFLIKQGEVELSKQLELQQRSPTEAEFLLKNFANSKKYYCKYKRVK